MSGDDMQRVLAMISKDMADDATRFNGQPFNGKTVAEYLGGMGAAIASVAEILAKVIEIRPDAESKGSNLDEDMPGPVPVSVPLCPWCDCTLVPGAYGYMMPGDHRFYLECLRCGMHSPAETTVEAAFVAAGQRAGVSAMDTIAEQARAGIAKARGQNG